MFVDNVGVNMKCVILCVNTVYYSSLNVFSRSVSSGLCWVCPLHNIRQQVTGMKSITPVIVLPGTHHCPAKYRVSGDSLLETKWQKTGQTKLSIYITAQLKLEHRLSPDGHMGQSLHPLVTLLDREWSIRTSSSLIILDNTILCLVTPLKELWAL